MNGNSGSAREAVERSAQAIVAGNIVQVMSDLTPEALAQVLQMASEQGLNPGSVTALGGLPGISGYTVIDAGKDEDSETFLVTFEAPEGRATVESTWKQVLGQWKIAAFRVVDLKRTDGEGG